MESVVCERALSLWLSVLVCVFVCVCATANQAEQRWSDFLPEITKPKADKGATQFYNSTRSQAKRQLPGGS